MAYLDPRTGNWRATVRRKGFPNQTEMFTNKKHAVAWERKKHNEIDEGKFKIATNATLRPLLLRFRDEVAPGMKSNRSTRIRINRFLKIWPFIDTPLSVDISPDIRAWRDRRKKQVSGPTVRRELSQGSAVVKHAKEEWNLRAVNPFSEVKKPPKGKKRDRRVEGDELEKIYSQVNFDGITLPRKGMGRQTDKIGWLVALAVETRMREGDFAALLVEDVHIEERYVRLGDTKNGDARDVALSKRATELFKRYLEGCGRKPGETLFAISPGVICGTYRNVCKKAGVVGLRFHDLKHEGVTRMTNKVGNALLAAHLSGHKDLKSTMIYYGPRIAEQVKALDEAGL